MKTLTEKLKKKARETGLAKASEDEIFDLVALAACSKCCRRANGGNSEIAA